MRFVLLSLPLLLACAAAHAERATERYAPAQISVAQDLLERARAAAALEQYTTAATYAQQAQVDARIAYGMTDAPALRAEAQAIHGAAAALTTNSLGRAAASYRLPSVQAQAAAPASH